VIQLCIKCNHTLPLHETMGLYAVYECLCGRIYELQRDKFFFPTGETSTLWVLRDFVKGVKP